MKTLVILFTVNISISSFCYSQSFIYPCKLDIPFTNVSEEDTIFSLEQKEEILNQFRTSTFTFPPTHWIISALEGQE